jgi:hypothetical protein
MDILDKLLNVGSAFDWITPSFAFVQDFLSTPVSDFGIPIHPYWGRKEIARLLKKNGIHVWGLMYNFQGDLLMFTVEAQQAELTCYLLKEAGVPILYAPGDFVNS